MERTKPNAVPTSLGFFDIVFAPDFFGATGGMVSAKKGYAGAKGDLGLGGAWGGLAVRTSQVAEAIHDGVVRTDHRFGCARFKQAGRKIQISVDTRGPAAWAVDPADEFNDLADIFLRSSDP